MKRSYLAGALAIVLGLAGHASAQTATPPVPPPQQPAGPVISRGFAGGFFGVEAVQNIGSASGIEAGYRVWRNLDVMGEAGWYADVVRRRDVDLPAPLVTYLQSTQGKTAVATMKAPSHYGAIGARWVFENVKLARRFRPYVQGGVGGAHVALTPTFTLAGSDVTSSLPQYGVTLGSDLTRTANYTAYTGGGGVLTTYRMLYIDAGYRLTSIQTDDQKTNVSCVHIGVGVRF